MMNWTYARILGVLESCAESFTFPVMDNGYVYLAATKMSVYRSDDDWAIVIEIFGFSPRSGEPDTHIYTFSSKLKNRNTLSDYVNEEAYKNYLNSNPNNESRFVHPIENDDWQVEQDIEYAKSGGVCMLRGYEIVVPEPSELGIELEGEKPLAFEFCRFLAGKHRDLVLCSEEERRINISSELELFLQIDDWIHPDISGGELPSSSETFRQIAEVLSIGNVNSYKYIKEGNTHWVNWPEAGTL